MAYIFVDGMDHYAVADTTGYAKYQAGSNWASMQTGLLGSGQCGRISSSNLGPKRILAAGLTTFVHGWRLRAAAPAGGVTFIMLYYDGSGNRIAGLAVTATNGLAWYRGDLSTQVAISSGGLLSSNAINYIEVKVTLAITAVGTIQVRMNGADVIPSTGSVQTASTTASMQQFQYNNANSGGGGGLGNTDFDDMYLFDTTGSQNNDFAGDSRITTVVPNGAGRLTQWTANGAGTDFGCVSETTPDGDTTYVSDSTVGHIDAYTLSSAGSPTAVKCVQVNTAVRKDDAATRTIATGIGNGATENFDAGTNIGTTYAYLVRGFDTNPLTSAAWATADLTTLQSAIKTIA